MYKKIILLTKSRKLNGYCVTGVDIDNGEWIRLMQPGEQSVSPKLFKYANGKEPELLDIIGVNLIKPCPTEMHPEDVSFDPSQIDCCIGDPSELVMNRLKHDYSAHNHVYHNKYPKLLNERLPRAATDNPYSLMIIDPEDILFRKVNEKRMDADFTWKGVRYKEFRITDSSFIGCFSDRNTSEPFQLDRSVYIVISLGEEYINPGNGNCEYYKLIAAVIDKRKIKQLEQPVNVVSSEPTPATIDHSQTYYKAKTILEKIAMGIDPATGEVLDEESVFQSPDVIRSLFIAIRLLEEKTQMKSSPKAHRSRKKPFSISAEEAQSVKFSAEPLPISRLVERINIVTDTSEKKKLTYKIVLSWLIKHGFLVEEIIEDSNVKVPTDKGKNLGISLEKRVSQAAGEYFVTLYDSNAQRFIVDNVNAIVSEIDV